VILLVVGIDLGTTFSAVAYVDEDGRAQIIPNRDGSRITPSVILFEDEQPIVGQQAKANSLLNPYSTVEFIKRKMGEKFEFESENSVKYTPEDLSAIILKRIKEDAQDFLGKEITEAVITVPAYFNDAQRKATQDAGKIAGLNVLAVINEPTAAALAYGMANKEDSGIVLVYDLGGGTFDATIMKIQPNDIKILATSGDKNLGGFNFDNEIINYVVKCFLNSTGIDLSDDDAAMQDLRGKAEEAKKALSTRQKTNISVFSQGKPFKLELTREKFEDSISALIDRTETILESVMEDSKLKWKDINKILLVGGSTRIPKVREMIKKISNMDPSLDINPDEAVAMGAAYYALSQKAKTINTSDTNTKQESLPPNVCNTKITDVNSHSLGILALDPDIDEMKNYIILPRNTSLPAKKSADFVTTVNSQRVLLLDVTQGEDADKDYITIIGTTKLELKDHPKGSPISVVMSYDENSIIHVNVVDLVDGSDLGEMEIKRKSNLDEEDVRKKTSRLSKLSID
jgi:molecular chaperone DnaK